MRQRRAAETRRFRALRKRWFAQISCKTYQSIGIAVPMRGRACSSASNRLVGIGGGAERRPLHAVVWPSWCSVFTPDENPLYRALTLRTSIVQKAKNVAIAPTKRTEKAPATLANIRTSHLHAPWWRTSSQSMNITNMSALRALYLRVAHTGADKPFIELAHNSHLDHPLSYSVANKCQRNSTTVNSGPAKTSNVANIIIQPYRRN